MAPRGEAGIIAPKVHVVGFAGDRGAGAGGLGSLPASTCSSSRLDSSRIQSDVGVVVVGGDDEPSSGKGESVTETGAPQYVANETARSSVSDKSSAEAAPTSTSAPSESLTKVRQHRGLYFTERIEPGEEFIFIPSRCMIGEEMLHDRGTIMLEQKGDGPAGHSEPYPTNDDDDEPSAGGSDQDDSGSASSESGRNFMGSNTSNINGRSIGGVSPSQTRTEMQNELMMLIEEISRMSTERKRSGGKHEWKADDSVALFLVGCKKIQSLVPFRAAARSSPPLSPENVCCLNNSNAAETTDSRPPPCFVPHVSMLPHSFPTNRLYYSPEELERMGGEIRTDGKRVTRKDMLKQIEYDHAELVDLLSEYYQDRGGIEAAKHVYKYCDVPEKEGPVGAWYSCFVLDPVLDLTIDSYKWALRYGRCYG